MIKWRVQSDWVIREGRRSTSIAKEGNPDAIQFPKAHVEDAPYDFSFSGLKSAVSELYQWMQDERREL